MSLDLSHARPHDLGGQAAGPVERSEHALEPWHRLVTGLMTALRSDRHLFTIDELRRAMEDMPAEDYRRLDYFERWAVGLSTLAIEKGLITQGELDRRIAKLGGKR